MSIKEGVSYDAARDTIEGFTDTGKTRTDTLANHANVFMVHGLVNKRKHGFTFSHTFLHVMYFVAIIVNVLHTYFSFQLIQ